MFDVQVLLERRLVGGRIGLLLPYQALPEHLGLVEDLALVVVRGFLHGLADGGELCGREDDLPVLSVPVTHDVPFESVSLDCVRP
ncbi:hypothetical protein ACFVVC_01690 [Pseudarthrobacter sp. NPDC058196]|uniref:hypothetical protein n=1 Tax=Pseudarthrobacter sp. NPDC058196 TaxID=3346376 RepID=UPI0036DE8D39